MEYVMTVRVEIRQNGPSGGTYGGGGLTVNEDFPFKADNFSELSRVLSRFHDLAEEIRRLNQAPQKKP